MRQLGSVGLGAFSKIAIFVFWGVIAAQAGVAQENHEAFEQFCVGSESECRPAIQDSFSVPEPTEEENTADLEQFENDLENEAIGLSESKESDVSSQKPSYNALSETVDLEDRSTSIGVDEESNAIGDGANLGIRLRIEKPANSRAPASVANPSEL